MEEQKPYKPLILYWGVNVEYQTLTFQRSVVPLSLELKVLSQVTAEVTLPNNLFAFKI